MPLSVKFIAREYIISPTVSSPESSKGKSMVAVLRPFNETAAKPFEVRHTGSERKQLADYLKSLDGETRVIMEHTGRYYEQIAQYLHDAGIYVSVVNPKLIKDYSGGNIHPWTRSVIN